MAVYLSPFKDTLDLDEDVLDVGIGIEGTFIVPPYRDSLALRMYSSVEVSLINKKPKRTLH